MALERIKALPTTEEIFSEYPVTAAHRIEEHRDGIRNVLSRADANRLLMIVGPCSAWPSAAVEHYAEKLARVQETVHEHVLLVLRTYIQKPRTAVGWPGPLNQPDPEKSVDIDAGIRECSRLMHQVGQMLPLADEMLFTHNAGYFEPRLSYVAVGARSAEDMEHRFIASGFDAPVGMKNPTSGSIETGVNSVMSAQAPHTFALDNWQVQTTGNRHAHLILRGGTNGSNYDPRSIALAHRLLSELENMKKIENPAVVIDLSHDNSQNGHGKDETLQPLAMRSVLAGIQDGRLEYDIVRGFMAESFLVGGKQSKQPYRLDGQSITDPCLDWPSTERMIRDLADGLDRRKH